MTTSISQTTVLRYEFQNINGKMPDFIPVSINVRDRKIVHEVELATIPSHGLLSLRSPQLPRGLLRHQNEVIHQQSSPDFHAVLIGLLSVLDLLNFHDQRVFDAEDRVGGLVWVVFEVESADAWTCQRIATRSVCNEGVSTYVIRGSYPSFLNMKCM
jgi:hypothetical protein